MKREFRPDDPGDMRRYAQEIGRITARARSVANIAGAVVVAATGRAAATDPLVAYSASGSTSAIVERSWDGDAWETESSAGSLGAVVNFVQGTVARTGDAAVVTIDTNRGVRLAVCTDGAWDGGTTLTSSAGTTTGRVAAARYESWTSDLLVVYRSGTSSTLRYRTLVSGVLSVEQSVSFGLSTAPDEIVASACPGSDDILVLARAGSTIAAAIWSGESFGSAWTLTTSARTVGWPMAGIIEGNSGDALAVWSEGTTVRFAVCSSGLWSSPSTAATPGGTVNVVRLAGRPRRSSDAAVLCYLTSTGVAAASVWSSSAWGNTQALDTSAHNGTLQLIDAAWQTHGVRAIVAWSRQNSATLRYRAWNGAAWSSEQTAATAASPITRIRLAPGKLGNEVLGTVRRMNLATAVGDYIVYGDSTLSPGAAVIHGPSGGNVAGVDLPSPPAPGAGTADDTLGNNDEVTLSPGLYGDYTFGNNCTVNLSAGTYRFDTFSPGNNNSLTLNVNASAGDVVFIVNNGNFDAKNNLEIRTTGGGKFTLHILNGNFSAKNNAVLSDVDLRVYNGSIDIEANLEAHATLWASSNVTLGSGDVYPPSWYGASSWSPLDAVCFTDGSAGPLSALSASTQGGAMMGGFDLFGTGEPRARVRSRVEVRPD